MVTRSAREADAPALARIYVESWRDTYAGILPDRVLLGMSVDRQAVHWQRQIGLQGPSNILRVAEDASGPVGLGSAGPVRGGAPGSGEVFTLYVRPDRQGQGIGRLLLGALFRGLVDAGCDRALLWVLAANPARFFYERVGGRRTVERTERLWGADLPEIAYVWDDLRAATAPGGPCSPPPD